jgi:nucleotide-binding universal stress UspA family protein
MPKILCCIDNTEASIRALAAATDLAKTLRASLVVFAANPLLPGRGAPIYLWPDDFVASMVDEAVRRAWSQGIQNVDGVRCRAFRLADAIVEYADEHAIDYIVVGTHDRSEFLRVFSGSVSREVIAAANCPVLAVRRLRSEPRSLPRRGLREPIEVRVAVPIAR